MSCVWTDSSELIASTAGEIEACTGCGRPATPSGEVKLNGKQRRISTTLQRAYRTAGRDRRKHHVAMSTATINTADWQLAETSPRAPSSRRERMWFMGSLG